MRKPPPSRVVTAEQVHELLAGSTSAIDPDLSPLLLSKPYRLAGDAVVLVDVDGSGRLYESRTELLAVLSTLSSNEWMHPLAGRLPQGQAFTAEVPRLAAELAEQVDAPLDGSEQTLTAIDELVRRRGAEAFLEPDEYPRLLAYVGEVVRHAVGGRWEMVLADEGGIWEPWIVDASGMRHPVFGMLVEELAEWNQDSSIDGLVAAHLAATRRRLKGPEGRRTPGAS